MKPEPCVAVVGQVRLLAYGRMRTVVAGKGPGPRTSRPGTLHESLLARERRGDKDDGLLHRRLLRAASVWPGRSARARKDRADTPPPGRLSPQLQFLSCLAFFPLPSVPREATKVPSRRRSMRPFSDLTGSDRANHDQRAPQAMARL
jgi:hypothetical protein